MKVSVELQNYLLDCAECNRLCRSEAVSQESREAKQKTKEVQTHQSNDLFMINAKVSEV